MTLKIRFTLALVGNTLAMLCLFGGGYYYFERLAALQARQDEQSKTMGKIESVCRGMYMASNPFVALNYINVLQKDQGVLSAACVSAAGAVQAHSDPKRIGNVLKEPEELLMLRAEKGGWQLKRATGGEEILVGYAPIIVGGKRVGMAQVEYDKGALDRHIEDKLWAILRKLLIVAGATFLLSIAAGLALALSLSKPIAGLVDAVRAVGLGEWDYSSPIEARTDELGFLAKEVNAMARKLKELDELKDAFIAMVSHDLRGPLGSIKMHADYLNSEMRGPLNAQQKEMLGICQDSAARLGVFIDSILDAAKIKAGRMEYQMAPFPLRDALDPVLQLTKLGADQKQIDLQIENPGNNPMVLGDREKIERVFANLIFNAVKHTPEKGAIRVSFHDGTTLDGGPSAVRVTVANSGPGIPLEQLARLFQRFYQADAERQRRERIQGTGLGLALVKQTIEAHQGKVWAESEPGQWVRFHFTLPLARSPLPSQK